MEKFNEDKDVNSSFNSLDVDKLYAIFKRSLVWIVLIVLVTNVLAYLALRWTKPVYQAISEIKLEITNDASVLNFSSPIQESNSNLNNISGEIEILKSELFFKKVLKNIDLTVSYYTPGSVLNDEKYKSSPIRVDAEIHNSVFYDRPIEVRFKGGNTFTLAVDGIEKLKGEFGKRHLVEGAHFVIHKTKTFEAYTQDDLFFILNSEQSLVKYLSRNLTVTPENISAKTLKLSFKEYNKEKALDIINVIDSTYLVYSTAEKLQGNNQKIDWLNKELSGIRDKMSLSESYFEEFTIENRTNDLDRDIEEILKVINELDSQISNTNRNLSILGRLTNKLEREDTVNVASISTLNMPESMLKSIDFFNEKVLRFKQVQYSYSNETFVFRKSENEVKEAQKELLQVLKSYSEQTEKDLDNLKSLRMELEGVFQKLPSKNTSFNREVRAYGIYEQLFLSLMKTKIEFEIARAGVKNNIIILSSAHIGKDLISPKKVVYISAGILSGLLFSILLIGIRYAVNNRINNVSELERLTMATVLGSIPKYTSDKGIVNFLVDKMPKSSVSESLRTIRTNIGFLFEGEGTNIISVTSTISGEGKTFVAANLGGITALTNKKVILIDLDMRKPRVHMTFDNPDNSKGISTSIIGESTLEEVICHSPLENFDYIPSGPIPPNPSELLMRKEFTALVEELKQRYDVIIFDTPPIGLVTDAIVAMKMAHIPIYVFRSDFSKKEFIKSLNRLMSMYKFNNFSVILNSVTGLGKNKYGYGYYDEDSSKRSKFKLRRD